MHNIICEQAYLMFTYATRDDLKNFRITLVKYNIIIIVYSVISVTRHTLHIASRSVYKDSNTTPRITLFYKHNA